MPSSVLALKQRLFAEQSSSSALSLSIRNECSSSFCFDQSSGCLCLSPPAPTASLVLQVNVLGVLGHGKLVQYHCALLHVILACHNCCRRCLHLLQLL